LGLKPRIGVPVTQAVGLDLLAPEAGVCSWPGSVLRAAVPETAVHKNDHSRRSEDDIGAPATIAENSAVNPKAEPTSVQEPAEIDLRLGVTPSRTSHAVAYGARRGDDA
jgi:hypothetical protein